MIEPIEEVLELAGELLHFESIVSEAGVEEAGTIRAIPGFDIKTLYKGEQSQYEVQTQVFSFAVSTVSAQKLDTGRILQTAISDFSVEIVGGEDQRVVGGNFVLNAFLTTGRLGRELEIEKRIGFRFALKSYPDLRTASFGLVGTNGHGIAQGYRFSFNNIGGEFNMPGFDSDLLPFSPAFSTYSFLYNSVSEKYSMYREGELLGESSVLPPDYFQLRNSFLTSVEISNLALLSEEKPDNIEGKVFTLSDGTYVYSFKVDKNPQHDLTGFSTLFATYEGKTDV